jgi:hypothetical protein
MALREAALASARLGVSVLKCKPNSLSPELLSLRFWWAVLAVPPLSKPAAAAAAALLLKVALRW